MSSTEIPNQSAWTRAFASNFLGTSPNWYKWTIISFLIINPILWWIPEYGHTIASWALVLEFIFTLAMALKCYPLQPGGLLALEAYVIGMATTEEIKNEVFVGFPVILLLMFMVAGIYFMKDLLLFTFTKLFINIRSKLALSLMFVATAAVLSAFLDALTVIAVIISVAVGFYHVYETYLEESDDDSVDPEEREQITSQFRAFMRNLLMHGAIGTALGGVMTTVGEPQNLLISKIMGWEFVEFFLTMAIVSIPVFFVGLFTCVLVELTKTFSFGEKLPDSVYQVLREFDREEAEKMEVGMKARLIVQAIAAVFLVFALGFHLAEVGIIGLTIIVIQTALNGVTRETDLGKAFEEALPFTALLVVFFAIVAVIHHQHLFVPIIDWVLLQPRDQQPHLFYIANGLLSAISDNVFVATVYISEAQNAFESGLIDREAFDHLGVAINTGTNIPSILTPNGQAAFLFLLTSSIAPLINLSYGRMVYMALPYFFTMGTTGWVMVRFFLGA